MYKVVVEFHDSKVLAINADNPKVAGQNIRKLFDNGKMKPQIKVISIFNEADDLEFDDPLYISKAYYD